MLLNLLTKKVKNIRKLYEESISLRTIIFNRKWYENDFINNYIFVQIKI